MLKDLTNNLDVIKKSWDRLSQIPLIGKKIFSKSVGLMAPYTGTAGIMIEDLKPGYGRASLNQRRKISNHLNSVHAIALANLAEAVSGVSLMYSLPPKTRGILIKFEISYLKKARGSLIATCEYPPPTSNENQDFKIDVNIVDKDGVVVSKATAYWKIGPIT